MTNKESKQVMRAWQTLPKTVNYSMTPYLNPADFCLKIGDRILSDMIFRKCHKCSGGRGVNVNSSNIKMLTLFDVLGNNI